MYMGISVVNIFSHLIFFTNLKCAFVFNLDYGSRRDEKEC